MRTLGVNGAGESLFLAVAEDGTVLDEEPYAFAEPAGLPTGRRLSAMRDEAEKLVRSLDVTRVRILDPETSYQCAAVSMQKRFALETLLALGAAEAGADCDRLSRAAARSVLGLSRSGQLAKLVPEVTGKVGKHWGPGKRDLAALAAIAADRQA